MAPVSAPTPATSRNSAPKVLAALAKLPLDTIAHAIGKDDSVACRVRSGDARLTLGEFCALLDAAGMKAVGANNVCVSRERYEMLAGIAAAAMADKEIVQRLVLEDEK